MKNFKVLMIYVFLLGLILLAIETIGYLRVSLVFTFSGCVFSLAMSMACTEIKRKD
jgi:hypothetical protein